MDTDSGCVYEDKTVIHELTQGLQMAQQLRVNLHSPEARDFYIQMILFSYEKALCVLRSGLSTGKPLSPALSAPSLPESSISFGSPGSAAFEFDKPFSSQQGENIISRKRKVSATWEDQVRILQPSPSEMLSNLRSNLSVNTSDLGGDSDTIPPSFSLPSTSSGLIEDFPNYYDDELLPIFSPPFISPVTSESNIFSEWGSSQSLDFLANVDADFEFNTLF